MSLILEALKKSEARRQLGNAPDFGTPFATNTPRRGLLPFIVIAIALVAGVGWWMLRRPATSVSPSPQVTSTPPASEQPKSAVPAQHSVSGAANPARSNIAAQSEPAVWVAAQRPQSREAARETREERQRQRAQNRTSRGAFSSAPVMGATHLTPAPSSTATNARRHPAPSAHVAATQPIPHHTTAPAPVIGVPSNSAQPNPVVSKPSTASDPTQMVAGNGNAPAKPAIPIEPATAPTDVPPYYQLSYDVRKALPALKLSMHVYSADPAARFVILNDSRMTEGEKTTDDVTLEKIVPDGVILEFQGHRFFYPRDAL